MIGINKGCANRTDKKQNFSEKVTKVESILAADGKTVAAMDEKPASVKAGEQKIVGEEGKGEGKGKEQQGQSQGPGTNKGTWASMFK
jgi:hypothetical protein